MITVMTFYKHMFFTSPPACTHEGVNHLITPLALVRSVITLANDSRRNGLSEDLVLKVDEA